MSCHGFIVDFDCRLDPLGEVASGHILSVSIGEEEEEYHKEYSVLSFLFAISVQRSPREPLKHDFLGLYHGFKDLRDSRSARDALRPARLL